MENKIVFDNTLLMQLALPRETIQYLLENGLPKKIETSIAEVINVEFYDVDKIKTVLHKGQKYLNIGNDGYCSLSIEELSGYLFSIDLNEDAEKSVVFINSTIEKFIECLQSFLCNKKRTTNVSYQNVLKDFIANLKHIDSTCMDEGNWWNIFVNEPC